jgi:anthranilate synthase component 1
VSNIKGNLRDNIGIKGIVKALFPGGTITGCPKVRCMEIISELEQMPREAYTGSVGYISNNGKMDFNILIRSFIQQDKTLSFRAGAGIVYDSDPENELAETRHKAQGLIKVFQE